ncbi:hypothetical protein RMATCC62417_03032 [Rhizopus microsporus]|nr:hypothetical protein RMATCC62417_03032 [Rhizopus microsporus]
MFKQEKKNARRKEKASILLKKDLVKIEAHRVGVTGLLYRQLKKRQKSGELLHAMMDEFHTSKVCHSQDSYYSYDQPP